MRVTLLESHSDVFCAGGTARQASAYTVPSKAEDKNGPLLHRHIIKHAIELHARHHDRMKPVTSSAAVYQQNSARKERGRPLYAPIMYVPHICQRDDAFLHHIPQIFDCRAGVAPYTWAGSRRRQERARYVGVQALRIPLARGGGSAGCGGRRNCALLLCWMQGEGQVGWSGRA
jgi:hypothetical protein